MHGADSLLVTRTQQLEMWCNFWGELLIHLHFSVERTEKKQLLVGELLVFDMFDWNILPSLEFFKNHECI